MNLIVKILLYSAEGGHELVTKTLSLQVRRCFFQLMIQNVRILFQVFNHEFFGFLLDRHFIQDLYEDVWLVFKNFENAKEVHLLENFWVLGFADVLL